MLLAAVSAEASQMAPDCAAPQEITRFAVKLPNTTRAIRSGQALVIVAIGSSSTSGMGASDPAHAYPARLAGELRARWPERAATVINKGVNGEIAPQMLARFESDVLPYHPQLVIWQTGSNRALRSENIEGYVDTLREGINRLKATRADIVLMDPQFAPRMLARPVHPLIVDSIHAVAKEMKVAVFRRFAMMRHWVESGRYKMEDITSSDGLHMNDMSYGCVARLLADSLVAAVEPELHSRQRSEKARDASR
jgi:lysophospholipase L1-like esterase